MRVLLLTLDFPPAPGGVQQLLGRLMDGLAARHEVVVVTPHRPGAPAWDAERRYRISRAWAPGRSRLRFVFVYACALVEIAYGRPDVVVCGHVLFGPLCRLVRRTLGIPFVVMAYGWEIRAPRMRRVARSALIGADRIVTISEFSRRAVIAFGVPTARVTVIHPGPGSTPEPGGGEAYKLSVVPPNGPLVLSVSRLVERYKGVDMVIRALPLIRAKLPTTWLAVVGDGCLRTYLERLASSLGVRDSVIFTGEVSDDELDTWYRRCDVFILASRESTVDGGAEGFGIVFIEANLRGKPVIGGRSGGIPDAVVDDVTGLLVNPSDIGEIAETVVRLLTDPVLAERLGTEGRRRALSELSWANYVSRFDDVLAAATGQNGAGT
jgi:phosphatidylinositol alpha-1,6-mannosyltransferase